MTLVSANVALPDPAGVKVVRVETTDQLRDVVVGAAATADAVVMAAAPGRLPARPTSATTRSRRPTTAPRRPSGSPRTPTSCARSRTSGSDPGSVIVGFAAETGDDTGSVLELARAKLARKGCDLLVVNDVSGGAVFGSPDNEAVILGADGSAVDVPRGSKSALAHVIWDEVASRLQD